MALVIVVVDTHFPRFEALAYVLHHFDALTHVVIRVSSVFIFQRFAEVCYYVFVNRSSFKSVLNLRKHRRTGRGGRGGLQPPQILGNSDFLGSERKFGQNQFFKTFPCFLNHYFEEINIIFSILTSSWRNNPDARLPQTANVRLKLRIS